MNNHILFNYMAPQKLVSKRVITVFSVDIKHLPSQDSTKFRINSV